MCLTVQLLTVLLMSTSFFFLILPKQFFSPSEISFCAPQYRFVQSSICLPQYCACELFLFNNFLPEILLCASQYRFYTAIYKYICITYVIYSCLTIFFSPSEMRSCASHYRCLQSSICLPQYYVCDGIRHCPEGDDERLCHFRYL